jgi:hypothetical protein
VKDFVGAEDGLFYRAHARDGALLCEEQPNAVWIAFLDGQEAVVGIKMKTTPTAVANSLPGSPFPEI